MEQQRVAKAAGQKYMEDDERVDEVSEINETHFEMPTSVSVGRRGRRQEPVTTYVTTQNCSERDCCGVGERDRKIYREDEKKIDNTVG